MKAKGGKNTPKTLAELRAEKRRVQAELSQAQGLTRQTRSKSVYANLSRKRSVKELEEKLNDIDLELEQRNGRMAKAQGDSNSKATLTTVFADSGEQNIDNTNNTNVIVTTSEGVTSQEMAVGVL